MFELLEGVRGVEDLVRKLVELVEIERRAQIEAMIEEIKRLSGEERERRGRAILGLRGRIVGEEFGYKLVKYGRRRKIETEIGVGDLVLISRGDPLKSDLVGVVTELGTRYIIVALEQVPSWALRDVRVDLYANDVTFRRWIDNLENLGRSGRRALEFSLGLREPRIPEPVSFDLVDRGLNDSQRRAVSLALGSDDFFLIHGPFGTGKTRTLLEVIRQLVRNGEKVLATADSNTAVDNLLEGLSGVRVVRLGHPSRVTEKLRSLTLSAMVLAHPRYREVLRIRERAERILEERDRYRKPVPAIRRGLSDEEILELAKRGRGARGVPSSIIRSMARWIELNREVDRLLEEARRREEEIAREIVDSSDVVLATNSTSFLLEDGFDVAVIDEATQATIPSCLIPIDRAERFIMAGDHKQLPPTVLEARELSETLFEILIKRYPGLSTMLNVQYRMNEILMDFPNRMFYGGSLRAHESVKGVTLRDLLPNARVEWSILDPDYPLVFVDTSRCRDRRERRYPGSTSYHNPLEAKIVVRIVRELLRMGLDPESIGVISPYDDQVDLLRMRLRGIEVKTVDGFQGREKEVIVISFVRSNERGDIGFLNDERRLNVSLTRARRKLIMVGDSSTLRSNEIFAKLLDHVRRRGLYYDYCGERKLEEEIQESRG